VNPGGPMPSVPQATRQPNMGAGVGEPDPKKIEEMFTQYTTGQITREDLLNFLHSESEGRGGILGFLEGMQEQGMGQPNTGTQPNQAKHTIPGVGGPGGATVQGGLVSPGAARVSIPPLEEPLDARHQKISTMLQGYGLGPADADQLSTILNPQHEYWREETEGEGAAITDPSAGGTPETGVVDEWTQTQESLEREAERKRKREEELRREREAAAAAVPVQPPIDLELEGGAFGGEAAETPETGVLPETAWKPETKFIPDTDIVKVEEATYTVGQLHPNNSNFKWSGTEWIPVEETTILPPQEFTKGQVNPSNPNQTWDGTKWVDKPVAAGPKQGDPNPDGSGTVWDEATKSYIKAPPKGSVPDYSDNPFFAGFTWAKGEQKSLMGGEGKFVDRNWGDPMWGDKPVFEDGLWWPNFMSHRMFTKEQDKQGVLYSQISKEYPDGQRPRKFEGWSGGEYGKGTAQWERGLLTESPNKHDTKEYRFVDGETIPAEQLAEWFYNYGHFPDGTWLEGWGPGTGKKMPPGFSQSTAGGKTVWTPPPGEAKKPAAQMPSGAVVDAAGNITLDGKDVGFQDLDGKITLTDEFAATQVDVGIVGTGQPSTPAGGEAGFGPTMTDLDLRGAGNFPMMNDFLQQLELGNISGDAPGASLTASLSAAITTLEVQKNKGDIAADQRMADVVMNSLDRAAVTLRAELDRELQADAAIGTINDITTLANKVEQNKVILGQSKISGFIPTMGTDGILVAGTKEGLEARVVTMTETEKTAQRNQNMSQLFGTWLDGDPTAGIETLEMQKFGLTKAITEAEMSGKIPETYEGAGGDTLAAKRMAWEKDVAKQNANTQAQLAQNGVRRNEIDLQISNNRIEADRFIAGGQLAEAVETRKDATFLAKQKLDLERDKMKLDTLASLANPATYLFAVRYGLLEQIGGTLGISWGDDVISSADLPNMVQPGTFPSLTDFQNATPVEREIMLAEVASSGGFTTDEAVRMIMEGAPGGRDIRRTSLIGVSR